VWWLEWLWWLEHWSMVMGLSEQLVGLPLKVDVLLVLL
jgi:hypothetical protein